MEWGPRKSYLETLLRYGKPLPEAYLNPPSLRPELRFALAAFWELSSDRQIGFSMGPIPFISVDAYCRRAGLSGGPFDRLREMVRRLDGEFLSIMAARGKGSDEPADDDPGMKAREANKRRMIGR